MNFGGSLNYWLTLVLSRIWRTKTNFVSSAIPQSNGFNPSWDELFDFGTIYAPSLAVLRVSVYHKEAVGSNELLGQSCIPLSCLRQGYRYIKVNHMLTFIQFFCLWHFLPNFFFFSRSVSLRNGFSEFDRSSGLSALLLYIELRPVRQKESLLKHLMERVARLQRKGN